MVENVQVGQNSTAFLATQVLVQSYWNNTKLPFGKLRMMYHLWKLLLSNISWKIAMQHWRESKKTGQSLFQMTKEIQANALPT